MQNSGPWDPWLPVVENSWLFAQRVHSARCAPPPPPQPHPKPHPKPQAAIHRKPESIGLDLADLHHLGAQRAFRGGGWYVYVLGGAGGLALAGGGGHSTAHPPSSDSGCLSLVTQGGVCVRFIIPHT